FASQFLATGARLVSSHSGDDSESVVEGREANVVCGHAAEWDTPRSETQGSSMGGQKLRCAAVSISTHILLDFSGSSVKHERSPGRARQGAGTFGTRSEERSVGREWGSGNFSMNQQAHREVLECGSRLEILDLVRGRRRCV